MLKRIILISAALFFAAGVFMTSVLRLSNQTVAQTRESNQILGEIKGKVLEEKVDYALTWPGLLPDHFLYPLKMLRDRVWLFLAGDSLEKGELLLRLADKRIWSAEMMLAKGKPQLAASTAVKAEQYLERSVDQEGIAREEEKETAAFLEQLSLAAQKHEEVLKEMLANSPDSAKSGLTEALEAAQKSYTEVSDLL